MRGGRWTLRFQRSDMYSWHTFKSSCANVPSTFGVMFCNFGTKKKKAHTLLFLVLCAKWRQSCEAQRAQRSKCQRSYLLVDGWEQAIRRGHILWHLHRSHASYSHRTQMLGHNITAFVLICGRVTKCLVPHFMACQVDSNVPAFSTGSFVHFHQITFLIWNP